MIAAVFDTVVFSRPGFRSQFPALTIVSPTAFLSHVRAEIARELGYE